MKRTISLEDAKLLKAVREDGTPLVAPGKQQESVQQPIVVQPSITLNPEIKSPVSEQPQSVVHVGQPNITVQPPDLRPVAEAISKSLSNAPTPTVLQAPAPDLTPVAEAINKAMVAVGTRPDHSEQIVGLLQQIASRPQSGRWRFTITRDSKGDIETMDAVKEPV